MEGMVKTNDKWLKQLIKMEQQLKQLAKSHGVLFITKH